MTHDASHSYTYDAENRVTQVDGGATAKYAYDPLGYRVEKIAGGVTTEYVYDPEGHVAVDANWTCGQSCWSAAYFYLNGSAFAEYTSSSTEFMSGDHLGSTRLLTNVSGGVVDNMDYLPFGEQVAGASVTTHKFTGYERDAESGLDNAQARYNSSSLGRFMSPDPLGNFVADATNPQTWNMYAYVNNNPLAFIDPTGLEGEGGGPPLRTLPSWFDCQPLMFTRTHGNPFDAGTPYGPTDFFDTQSTFCGAGGDFARHIVDGGGVGGARPQAPTFKQQYNQCVQGAGTTLKVADTLGVWGLGSLAVTAGSSAFTSTMQWIHGTSATNIASTVAQQAPNTAADAGTLANMGEHELFLEGTWATVGKISLWVTAGATAVSGGVRGYCAAKAAF